MKPASTQASPTDVVAGDWSVSVEPDGTTNSIRFRGDELLAGVLYVVRAAHTWDTVVPEVKTTIDTTADGFTVTTRAEYAIGEARFVREQTVEARGTTITWTSSGRADAAFEVNRNGFVVLHHSRVSGRPVTVVHGDGSCEASTFPVAVSPDQPFTDVAGFETENARLDLAGDVFETEDQRNWSDASFKTYSRPLALPFPFPVAAGEAVEQSITLTVTPRSSGHLSGDVSARDSAPHTSRASRPALGICLGPGDDPARAAELVRQLGVAHLRVDVVLSDGAALGLDRVVAVAHTGTPIDLVVHVGTDPAEGLEALAAAIRKIPVTLSAVTVLDNDAPATTDRAWAAARAALAPLLHGIPLLAGADDNFAELNRNRPDPAWGADGVSLALNPQLHDRREAAILETVHSLPAVVDTARMLAPAVAVGALTMRPRRNIYRSASIDRLGRDADSIDERQDSEFAATWLRSTLTALADAGVSRITALECEGPRGVVAANGSLLPVGEVLAECAEAWR